MIISKKNKGKKTYYYLQQTIREKGKVMVKEKYLGNKIPKDIAQIKKSFQKTLKKELYEKLESIKENFQEEWKRIPESVKKKELEEISIAFTYNTNAIEGSTITLEETRGIIHDKISPTKPIRDVKESEMHSKIFLEMLEKKQEMSNSLLLYWHKNIFQDSKSEIAGKFREYLVRVGDHLAPDWQDVKKLMNSLISFINKNEERINVVELAAIAHYKFEKIHPFGDGNGRIGRLLMNQILWHNNYPMLVIEYKNRKSYYKALKKDEENFIKYFLRRYLSVHKKRYMK